ncbi:hypothetical protein H9L17_10075 [Thermomonas brevis]|uniref:Uncharacterized protein n=1 Tax=Thermomonas brevis TaxID=215691 RepID=A0A7G9QQD9_9GAMM|nr:hypothetical protein [Thermomonas brevis]QNN45564.1 hypothetical protein H9L17_10075 [Thermomonas brevis]
MSNPEGEGRYIGISAAAMRGELFLDTTRSVAPHLQHRFHAASTPEAAIRETDMFKVIGGVVLYGFALLGLATYLDKLHPHLVDE